MEDEVLALKAGPFSAIDEQKRDGLDESVPFVCTDLDGAS
jgi:hypothetical protein